MPPVNLFRSLTPQSANYQPFYSAMFYVSLTRNGGVAVFLYNSGASWRHARWRDDRTPRRRGANPPPTISDPCTPLRAKGRARTVPSKPPAISRRFTAVWEVYL